MRSGFQAFLEMGTVVVSVGLYAYFKEGGIRNWLEHRKFLRKLKEGKSMKFDVVEP